MALPVPELVLWFLVVGFCARRMIRRYCALRWLTPVAIHLGRLSLDGVGCVLCIDRDVTGLASNARDVVIDVCCCVSGWCFFSCVAVRALKLYAAVSNP